MNIIHGFFIQNLFVMAIYSQRLDNSLDHDISLKVQRRQVARQIEDAESLCGIHTDISDGHGNRVGINQLTDQIKDCCCRLWWFEQQKELRNLDPSDYKKSTSHDIFVSHDIAWKPRHKLKIDDLLNYRHLQAFKERHIFLNLIKTGRQKHGTCRTFKHLKACCDTLKQQKNEDSPLRFSLRHRKLLQLGSESIHYSDFSAEESRVILIEGGSYRNSSLRNSTFNGLSYKQWRELIEALQRNMSRDHVWAMLSIVCLIVVMMFAMKVCGLKPMKRSHERHLDYVFRESDHHTASIREILALKRPYLPQSIVRLSKRWRWKRKKRSVKFQERDIVDALSDNSEEERLIYSAPFMDF